MKNLFKIVIVAIAALMFTVAASAATDTDGYVLISTPEEFAAIYDDLSGDYRLAASIDFTGVDFAPIGSYAVPFTGNFDGAGYTLSGIEINKDATSDVYVAPFAYNSGRIENLVIDNIVIAVTSSDNAYVGALAALNDGVIDGVRVKNAHISVNTDYKAARAGGVCAYNFGGGSISDCSASAKVSAVSARLYADAAGIAAINIGNIEFCEASGEVKASAISCDSVAGGIVSSNGGSVVGCVNSAEIRTASDKGYATAGGVLGRSDNDAENCVNRGCVYVNGVLDETTASIGDVNLDGSVTVVDAIMLARSLGNWNGYDVNSLIVKTADVNADGDIGIDDATILIRHLAKWSGYETLPYKQTN